MVRPTSHPATRLESLTARLASLAFALVMTMGTLGGIDRLAQVDAPAGQLAQAAASAPQA